MKQALKKTLCVVLCLCLLTAVFPLMSFAADTAHKTLTASDKITVKGTAIYTKSGQEIALKGVNLGNWLTYEQWMGDMGVGDDVTLLDTLEQRFGKTDARALVETYWKNWITTSDLDRIAALGFNCVRVPFWYRDFQNANGEWYLDANGKPDLSILEWVVSECAKRGLYVILDLHGAPGGQSFAEHTGQAGVCKLYDDTADGEQYRAETVILWKEIAARFKDAPNIAAYDLLNEPTCDMKNASDLTYQLWSFYNELYAKVRAVDADTPIMFEAIWQMTNLPSPTLYGWTNVIYSQHFYDYTTATIDLMVTNMVNYRKYYDVPVFVGECNYADFYSYALQKFCQNGIGFTVWSYKSANSPSGDEVKRWFMYSGTNAVADIKTATYAELNLKWSVGAWTESMTENTAFTSVLKTAVETKSSAAADSEAVGPYSVIYRIFFTILSFFRQLSGKTK